MGSRKEEREVRGKQERDLRREERLEGEATSKDSGIGSSESCGGGERDQAKKSVGRKPSHQEPKKDAESSEKQRGDANSQRAADVRMGKPGWEKPSHCKMNK